ncbi:MAG: response regulator [bacterium]|nr:response regulator [bacterium]
MLDFIHPDDVGLAHDAFEAVRTGRGPVHNLEVRVRHKDGGWRCIEGSGAGLVAADGTKLIVANYRDVTKRRELESQLGSAQKMEAVGQLAGGVAHDFNNLLQVIGGYAELALGRLGDGDPQRQALEQVTRATEKASVLTRQLLAFGRRQVLELEDLDLGEIANDLGKMIRGVVGEHISLNIRAAAGSAMVRADRGQIEQILMNLCVNARDAMPDGGDLTVATETASLDETHHVTQSWVRPGNYAVLSVTDTGCGMDSGTQDRVFEPFFTTKDKSQGMGLGLASVFGIVRQHKGAINVYSEVGMGSTFRVYFPLLEERTSAPDEEPVTAPRGGTETILMAEDNAEVRSLARRVLMDAGYRVLEAEDGVEAIAVLDEYGDKIDLALLDMIMPKSSGRVVFDHIREHYPSVRVLFCSGYNPEGTHGDLVADTGAQLIQKPYQRHALLQKVREILDS